MDIMQHLIRMSQTLFYCIETLYPQIASLFKIMIKLNNRV